MAKALTLSDIEHEAERWAKHQRDLARLEKAREEAMAPVVKRHAAEMAAVLKDHDPKIDALEKKADAIYDKVIGWLKTRKKTTTIESKSAIAEIVHGSKPGNRLVDVDKLQKLCKKKSVDFWQFVNVLVGELDKKLGKAEVDAISTREPTPSVNVSLKLK